ncbi:MAG TPA: FtsX-like permease family protein, partial [Rhodobacteraceae bacterium]|nr:FtsX-like permease family protein [Paracoccaceae bacterium]
MIGPLPGSAAGLYRFAMAALSESRPPQTAGSPPSSWRTGLRLARRELRSGLKGLWIFFTCLLLGVTAISVVGSLSASVERGMADQARPLLGGDVEFAVLHRQLNDRELAYLARLGKVSMVADMRGIARRGQARAMVEVKAVDDHYPMFGQVELAGGKSFAGSLAKTGPVWSALAEPGLFDRLGIRPGGIIELGRAKLVVGAVIRHEPDRITGGFILAPRLMISREALAATGLVTPGSLITWRYRVRLEGSQAGRPPAGIVKEAKRLFPDAGWRITTRDRSAPGAERFLQRLTLFLTLAGLTALIVGGVGVANAVTTFLDQRRESIATLKCLGASGSDIFAVYLIEILSIATLAILGGLFLGALAPLALPYLLAVVLPVPLAAGVAVKPLLLAAAFGYLVAIAFAVWPLARACKTPASSLFRGGMQEAYGMPSFRYVLVVMMALAALVLLVLLSFPRQA